jgi:predicted MFS family arabinose efflux permease
MGATKVDSESGFRSLAKRLYPYGVLALLLAVYVLSYLDRQLVSILAQPIKQELQLSDTQLGLISGFLFAVFYTGFGIPIAFLADRSHRTRIVALSCGLWSLFTGACGLVSGFSGLALARLGVGIGEAGGTAPSYAIVADYFEPQKRGFALGLFSLGLPLGTALGGVLAGSIAPVYGWRAAFVLLAIPGILLAMLLPVLVREPLRGRFDAPATIASKPPLAQLVLRFCRTPVLVWTTLGTSFSGLAGYGLLTWAPALLMRCFAMPLAQVGHFYSPLMGLAVAVGVFGSGFLGDRWQRTQPRAHALLPALCCVLAAPLFALALTTHTWFMAVLLLMPPLMLGFTYLSPALAIVQNTSAAQCRATNSAILLFALNLCAIGLGPVLVGGLSDHYTAGYGDRALLQALWVLLPFFLLGSFCNFMAARCLASAVRQGEQL